MSCAEGFLKVTMVAPFQYFTIGFLTCLVCLVASVFRKTSHSIKYRLPLPPGSLGLPLIGETLQFIRYIRGKKPWEFIETREKKYGEVFKTSLFGSPIVVVSPPKGNKFVFANHNVLVETAWPSPMKTLVGSNALNFMSGDEAKNFRDVLLTFLGANAVQTQISKTSTMIQDHLDKYWKDGEIVLAYPLIKRVLFSVTCNSFLSVTDEKEQENLLGPLVDIIEGLISLPLDLPWTSFHKAKAGRVELYKIFDEYIKQRRASPRNDLISMLLDNMTDEQVKDNILSLLFAGHDTSSSSLSMTVKCLAQNPDCFEELRKEHLEIASTKIPGEALNSSDLRKMKYTWMVVQETLRLMPSSFGILRRALTDFEMDGYTVPKGWQLMISGYRTNQKEEFFAQPDKFDPTRFAEGTGPLLILSFPLVAALAFALAFSLPKCKSLCFFTI